MIAAEAACDSSIFSEIIAGTYYGRDISVVHLIVRGYFDESGGRDTRFFVLGGLIAGAAQWQEIERRWRAALLAYDAPAFHAKDVQHGWKDFGDRSVWPRERRERFARSMGQLLAEQQPMPVITAIDVEMFERLVSPSQRRSLGIDPY